jgi:hypothetical protein
MNREMLSSILLYSGIAVLTIAIGIYLWSYFDARTYRIVTVFISIIILSNCLAKLFAIFIFRELP